MWKHFEGGGVINVSFHCFVCGINLGGRIIQLGLYLRRVIGLGIMMLNHS